MKGWVELKKVKYVYGDIVIYDFNYTSVKEQIVIRKSGWTVMQGTSKKWWALHDVEDDAGPFDTKEDAQNYVEVTYALGSD